MPDREPQASHPSDTELAAWLGRELEGDARNRVELHLAHCPECRAELMDARQILGTSRARRRRTAWIPVAAAAVALLFFAWPTGNPDSDPRVHRDGDGPSSIRPELVHPLGMADEVEPLVWRHVAGSDRYRLTLYEADGSLLWRETTPDSFLSLPDSVVLGSGRIYLWQVEARVGWDVWEASALGEFTVAGPREGR